MGSSSSKFKKYLQHGDEYAAMQVYQHSAELRRSLQPNCSYGDNHHHNTPMHYAAKHGMKHLIRAFLNDLGGNPNIRNARGQTSLHCVCQISHQKSPSALERRSYSVILLLSWRGPRLPSGDRERVEVFAKDIRGNTALHYAASNGLKKCVEYLVAHGADVYAENIDGLNAADLALRENHNDIALFLEARMAFTASTPASAAEDVTSEDVASDRSSFEVTAADEEARRSNCGLLRSQDLQEAKEQIIVEVADTFDLPIFSAESLLKHNDWSREAVLESWQRDPVETCLHAGIQPPCSVQPQSSDNVRTSLQVPVAKPKIYSENSFIVDEQLAEDECLCEVCCDLIDTNDQGDPLMPCRHKICARCWKLHVSAKMQDSIPSPQQQISCPASDCNVTVPIFAMERCLGEQQPLKKANSNNKKNLLNILEARPSEIASSTSFSKKCPVCSKTVCFAPDSYERDGIKISHSVDCGNGHFFCWECGSADGHAPVGCSLYSKWLEKCGSIDSSRLFSWLETNSRGCSNCGQMVEKLDGCNRAQCGQCGWEFCWVCLENWKKHPMCNRFLELTATTASNEELRFVHFYVRFRNHSNSRKMEESRIKADMTDIISNNCYCPRRHSMFASEALLASSTNAAAAAASRSKFYEEAAWELLKTRSILKASYVYGYFHLDEHKATKSLFELMQHELEDIGEKLSEMLQRPSYLKTPKRVLVQASQCCLRKRTDFLKAIYNGLQFEDPWRINRNVAAPQGGNAAQNKRDQRQIWTKTLSLPSKKCQRPGCTNSCSNVRSSFKSFCSPACAQQPPIKATVVLTKASESSEIRRVFNDLHNTLPRSSKSEADLLSKSTAKQQQQPLCKREGCTNYVGNCGTSNDYCSVACAHFVNSLKTHEKSTTSASESKVKAAGYQPLVNEGGSTTSEDTLKASVKQPVVSSPVETTSQRKTRPKLFRQKSFEIISDCESADTSLADVSNIVSEAAANPTAVVAEALKIKRAKQAEATDVAVSNGTKKEVANMRKKRPALTIKIQNSSFQDNDNDEDFASELDKSPNFCISGVNISRSPGGSSAASASLSPRWLNSLSGNANNRNRSSSLIVPPVIRRKVSSPSSGGSPGSKSLHLSPLVKGVRKGQTTASSTTTTPKSPTLFTFPDPGSADSSAVDSGLSSIVHVDRYLSSEDFHEALFFEKSPKSGQKKRSRRTSSATKKNKNTDNNNQPLSVTLI